MSLTVKQKLYNACHNYEEAFSKYCVKEREHINKMQELERIRCEFRMARDEFRCAELDLTHASAFLKSMASEQHP